MSVILSGGSAGSLLCALWSAVARNLCPAPTLYLCSALYLCSSYHLLLTSLCVSLYHHSHHNNSHREPATPPSELLFITSSTLCPSLAAAAQRPRQSLLTLSPSVLELWAGAELCKGANMEQQRRWGGVHHHGQELHLVSLHKLFCKLLFLALFICQHCEQQLESDLAEGEAPLAY